MVNAFASENNVVLGQIKTQNKSNEITAIPALLNLLDIKGCLILIDAIGCQMERTRKRWCYDLSPKNNTMTLM